MKATTRTGWVRTRIFTNARARKRWTDRPTPQRRLSTRLASSGFSRPRERPRFERDLPRPLSRPPSTCYSSRVESCSARGIAGGAEQNTSVVEAEVICGAVPACLGFSFRSAVALPAGLPNVAAVVRLMWPLHRGNRGHHPRRLWRWPPGHKYLARCLPHGC